MPLNLFDILWEDILLPLVASRLELKDLYNLSLCSKQSEYFVNLALKSVRKVNLEISQSFMLKIVANNCTNLTEFIYKGSINEHLINLLKRNPEKLIKISTELEPDYQQKMLFYLSGRIQSEFI